MLKQCIENKIDLILIDDTYAVQYKEALNKAQMKDDDAELKKIFILCQKRLDQKLSFLKETLQYMKTHPMNIDDSFK